MTLSDTWRKTRVRNRRGVSAVEFALILPLLVVLLFGLIEFGLLLYNKQVVTNASREGARAGILFGTPRLTQSEIKSVVANYCRNHLITFGTGSGYDGIPGLQEPNVTFTTQNAGDPLAVTVQHRYTFLVMPGVIQLPFISGSLPNFITLQGETVMRYE